MVQTRLGKYATKRINTEFKTDINVGRVGLQLNGDVELKEILVRDHHSDTLISIGELNTSIISFKNLYSSKLNFGDIDAEDLKFNIHTYKDEGDTSLDVFVAKFEDDNASNTPSGFLFSSSDITIQNGLFKLSDANKEFPSILHFSDLNINATDFVIAGPEVRCRFNKFSFKDQRGVVVENFETNFEYTKTHMIFDALNISTKKSELQGNLRFDYNREDFKNFTNKVQLTANFKDSKISLTELNTFYDEFGVNQIASLNTQFSGTLNNLKAKNLRINTTRNTRIIGDIGFKNIFNSKNEGFSINGNFRNLASNYKDLTALMPNILTNALPTVMDSLGNFKIKGTTKITTKRIDADIEINTDIGKLKSNLQLTNINDIDNASYKGVMDFTDFDFGVLIADPKTKLVTADLEVDGKGFTLENLDTQVIGLIPKLEYNGYTYSNIEVSGTLGDKIFNGKLKANDPNLKLDFDGLADLSQDIKTFNFNAKVEYFNLNVTNFVTRDKISEFKGQINIDAKATDIDDLVGDIKVKKATYKNQDDTYGFKDFDVVSSINNKQERVIAINSPEIINGTVKGKFKTEQVLKLVENALGNIYTNYNSHPVEANQYLEFRFNIYSKIATVLYKDLVIGENTFIKGKIATDSNGFELNFNSPEIKFKDYYANKINLQLDNNNPVYNTFIEIDKLGFSEYNTSNFTLINATKRDTLFIKTEFKGGKNEVDNYHLNLFYTINNANNSVVGFQKSDLRFKGYNWLINEKKDTLNKVVFDKDFKFFEFFPIRINQGKEEILFSGNLTSQTAMDLELNFKDVELAKITPRIDSLALKGDMNGKLQLAQKNGVYFPKSNLNIRNLFLNNFNVGDLTANVEGNSSLTSYNVDVELLNKNVKTLSATGDLDVDKNNPTINVDVAFQEFLLDPLNPLGEGVINRIRGLVSGNAKVTGSLKKPSIDGELFMDKAGLAIPYLNVDYGFREDSRVVLQEQRFIFDNIAMTDPKYLTEGYLNGFIEHNNFSDWHLGLKLNADRLLVLDTKATEDALYYGTGFVTGNADIYGPTAQLKIDFDGSTAEDTYFNVPLNDSESFGDNSFMRFISPEEKQVRLSGVITEDIEISGLELNFDLDVNQNATIEIVIDKEQGSTIKGKGEGTLGFFINTNGSFNMWGDFSVFEGEYNFRYQGIVEKRFKVEPGSNLYWDGSPYEAEIDIRAIYEANANPSVLLDSPIAQSIPVEVEIEINGELKQPDLEFYFDFPTVNSTIKSELDYRLSARDERQNQALFFLTTGSFASGLNDVNFSGTIAERLSGIVNNLLGSDDSKINVGVDFELGQDTPQLQTNNRVGLTLQTKISDRILVNGKVGVPFGSAQQTTITGDVQIDWLLNEDGTLRASVFNRENTIRNFGEEIGFTQGLGLSYNVEFDSFKELLQIIFSGKNRKDKKARNNILKANTEKELTPDYIQFKSENEK